MRAICYTAVSGVGDFWWSSGCLLDSCGSGSDWVLWCCVPVVGAQQDAAEANDPADQAAVDPAGAATPPDAEGHRQAPRGGAGGHCRPPLRETALGDFFLLF